jgi:hypothetical protein
VLAATLNGVVFELVLWPSFCASWIVHGIQRRVAQTSSGEPG